eukprot:SAG31_NODE_320_length_17748_cov_4.201881_9_plen_266_part_00
MHAGTRSRSGLESVLNLDLDLPPPAVHGGGCPASAAEAADATDAVIAGRIQAPRSSMGAVPRRGIVSTISWHRLRLLFAATCAALPAASAAAAPPGQQERQLRINFAGPSPLQSGDGGCSAGSPAAVTAAARQVCGGRAIAGAVHEIFQVTIADTSEQKLAELGLATVLDLQLLDMAETTELMAELKSSGAGVGERSKLRVLIRDAEQNHKTSWHTASTASSTVQNLKPHVEAREGRQWRKLQESATSSDDERGMSVDTVRHGLP